MPSDAETDGVAYESAVTSTAPTVHILVIGDSTCSVAETASAVADGVAYEYCDPRTVKQLNPLVATLPSGVKLLLKYSNGRESFRAETDALNVRMSRNTDDRARAIEDARQLKNQVSPLSHHAMR